MGLFSKTQRKLVGIDISSAAVKLIELSRSESGGKRSYRVEACASDMLPPGAVDARKIKQTDAVSDVVRDVRSAAGPRRNMRPLPFPALRSSRAS